MKKILLLLLLAACTGKSNKETTKTPDLQAFVKEWNTALAEHKTTVLASYYADNINFYGKEKSKEELQKIQADFFKIYADYYQQIKGDISTSTISDKVWKCTFVKSVTTKGKTTDYTAYFHVQLENDKLQIILESDLTTDANLKKAKDNFAAKHEGGIVGDFDGDGEKEELWIVKPKIIADEMDCDGTCESILKCSNPKLNNYVLDNSIGGDLTNFGDLDEDGKDEIGILPHWFTSCWKSYFVLTYQNDNWANLISPVQTHCTLFDDGYKVVEKTGAKSITVRYCDMNDVTDGGDIKVHSKKMVLK